MQATRDVIKQGIMLIDLSYPNFLKDKSTDQKSALVNLWFSIFKDVDSEVYMEAIKQTIETTKYLPTIADVKENIDRIINGSFNAEEIWNSNYPLMMEMLNNNQDDIEWYRDDNGLECKHNYFNAWQKLHPTLKATFVRPSAVVDLMRASDFEYNSFKNRYCKEAINLEKEFRESPGLRELVKKQRKPIELETLKNEIGKLSYEEKNLLKG